MRRIRLWFGAVIGLLLLLLSGVATADSQPTAQQLMPNDPVAGKAYFQMMCAPCHGPLARGTPGVAPNISGIANRFPSFYGVANIIEIRMPPPGGTTSEQNARNVAAYLWTLDGLTPPPPGAYDAVASTGQVIQNNPADQPPTPAPTPTPTTPAPTNTAPTTVTPTPTASPTSTPSSDNSSGGGAMVPAAEYLTASVGTANTSLPLGAESALGYLCLGAGLLLQGLGRLVWQRRSIAPGNDQVS